MIDRTRRELDRLAAAVVRVRALLRRFLLRYLPSEAQHVFALTLVVGAVCGLVAVAFHLAIQLAGRLLIDRVDPGATWTDYAWTIALPTLVGAAAGAVLAYVVPGARGSGIPQVKRAFALEGGRLRFRDAFGKFWIASAQIGSGASLGREGPTVQICAGAASLLARATSLPPKSMKRMVPVGVAAGIAAAFNAPIAAVTFTIEEIVGTLDQAVLSGVVVAAAIAAVIERSVLGVHPIIEVAQPYGLEHASSLLVYALLGVAAAMVSIAFTDGLLGVRARFARSRIPLWLRPAIGGCLTGVIAVIVAASLHTGGVTGGGYHTLGLALAGSLGLRVLAALCVAKLIATVLSYSSGGAGGIFAPALFVGAMLGGLFGFVDVRAFGPGHSQLGAFALVGMGAVFAGVIRAPITSVLIIFEMTGGYGLVLPLMIANMTAYGLARRWRPTAIYDALLEQDGVHLPHHTSRVHPLDQLTAGDVMTATVIAAPAGASIDDADRLTANRSFTLLPVLDRDDRVAGAVPVAQVRAEHGAGVGSHPVRDLLRPIESIPHDTPLLRAAMVMNERKVRQLVVVDPRSGAMVGMLAMSDIVRAHAQVAIQRSARPEAAAETAAETTTTATRVGDVAVAAELVAASTTLDALVDRLAASADGALPVALGAAPADGVGVVVLDQIRELWRDPQLRGFVIAADVATPSPPIDADAELGDALRRMAGSDVVALAVADATGAITGVVTRARIGRYLFDRYTRAAS